MNDNGQNFISFLVGFLVGGLIGAAVALLYAPQSGEETRAVIRDRSIELRDQAAEEASRLRAQTQSRFESLQSEINVLREKVQKQAGAVEPPAAE